MSRIIKDYKIIRILGKGSYASAYLVTKELSGINKSYVIKQIPLEDLSPSEKEEVKTEAKLLSQIKSDFVVKYYESFEENNFLNIVMEYCELGDLEHLLKQRNNIPLNDNFIWKLFIQIVIGLADLHNMKILHRDLKTSNIFLTKNYDVKIGDLGVAKKLSNNDFTKTVIGTPYYLSPEICKEKPYNEKSDIWALGCILYELCTFKHPFDSTNQAALINKILKENPKQIPYTFDYYFNEIIKKLLQKNMNKRPSCKLILKGQYVMNKAKELKLYSKYQKLIEYSHNNSLVRNKSNLKVGIEENYIHNEKTRYFTINNNTNDLSIKNRAKSCSKNKKIVNHILNESKKAKPKKNGIPFVKKNNPFINEKDVKKNTKQVSQEIIRSITNRKNSKKKLLKLENKSINIRDRSKNKEKNNLKMYLVDTLEMNKSRFNKREIKKDKSPNIINNLNNNISNNKENSAEKNIKNDKNNGIRSSAFHIYYNKNIQTNEKTDNYLSDSDEEKLSNIKDNKKPEEKSDNEDDGLEEERVRTIINDENDTCYKNNNENIKEKIEDINFLIKKTKKKLFGLLGEEEFQNFS